MKLNLYISIFLLLNIVNLSCRKGNNNVQPVNKWINIPTPYFGEPLDIQFVNADTGYILGVSEDTGILIKTIDGGKSWKTITFSTQFMYDTSNGPIGNMYVSSFNSDILFSSGSNLIRSMDGGSHWEIVQRHNVINPATMHFFNPEKGVALGINHIYKTTDSGFIWIDASYPETEFGISLIQFPSQELGYSIEYTNVEGNDGYYTLPIVLKSPDEGNTWHAIATLNYPFNDILSLHFVNDSVGYLIKTYCTGCGDLTGSGYPQDAELLKTRDGGKTWSIINNNLPTGKKMAIYFTSESEGFLIEGTVHHTVDGGKTWQKIEGPSIYTHYCFPNDHILYAIGQGDLTKLTF